MQSLNVPTTHSNLLLRGANDAQVLFQAVRQGHFQLIRSRLNDTQKQRIAPGHVYVWADGEGPLRRWTDGHNWSPSRVRGVFLVYDEMPEPPDASPFIRRKKPAGHPGEKVKRPRKKRLLPLPDGLVKQTYSATLMEGGLPVQKWHLTAYSNYAAVPNLQTVEDDPILRQTVVPPNSFIDSMIVGRKSKSSKGPNQRKRSNLKSADKNSLVNSPVQEYTNHASDPNTYDDCGSGSTGSAGTIRDEASITSHDSFGGAPVSPIFDQPPPPLFTRLEVPDARRGLLASVDPSQFHASTSTASSRLLNTSSFSSLVPWAGPGSMCSSTFRSSQPNYPTPSSSSLSQPGLTSQHPQLEISHPSTAVYHHQQYQQNLRQGVSAPLHPGLWLPMTADGQPMHSPSHTGGHSGFLFYYHPVDSSQVRAGET